MTTTRQRKVATARKGVATRRRRADPLVKAEDQRRVTALWVAGATVAEIARATKLSEATIYRVRQAAIASALDVRDSNVAALREAELLRIDRLQRAHWSAALDGGIGSSKIVLMCIDKRCKLLGLDAPVKVDATVKSELDAEIEQLVKELETNGLVITKGSSE